MNRSDIVVRYGLATDVLADRGNEQRTDYAAVCSACPVRVSVDWPTLEDARKDAVKHAHEHGGAKVEHTPAQDMGEHR